jgi:hypothetical protein
MDNLAKLQRRKAELAAQIEQQRSDLKNTMLEIREEIEPSKLLKKAVSGALGMSADKLGEDKGVLGRLPAPISFVLDLLVRDPRLSFLIKLVAPLALKYLPSISSTTSAPDSEEKTPEKPVKVKIYSRLRQGISALRGKLRKQEPSATSETPEN